MARPTISTKFAAVDQVSKPIDKMQRKVTGFSRNVQKSFGGGMSQSIGRFRGLVASAAAILTTGVIARGINAFASKGDEIAKTSRQIGLSAEALQELRFAADRQGVSSENLTKAFQLLNKNVGDLKAGQGTLRMTLQRTNPQFAKQLESVQDTEEAFIMLLEEVERQPDQMKKAALAQAAFGRSGQEMLKIFEAGTVGLEDLRKEARKYGDVISTDAANKSEKFVDALTNMKAAMNSVKNNALAPMIESLTPLIQKMADWITTNRELVTDSFQKFLKTSGDIIRKLWEMRDVLKAVAIGFVAFKAVMGIVGLIQGLTAAVAAFNLVLSLNPLGLVIGAVVALTAAMTWLEKKYQLFSKLRNDVQSGRSEADAYAGMYGSTALGDYAGLHGANDQAMRSYSESKSTVDINFGNMPQNTEVKKSGKFAGVRMNYGYAARGH